MAWPYIVQQCLNALQVSAFYALLASAYVLVHGVADRINLAFGAIAMWGACLTIGGIVLVSASADVPLAALAFGVVYALVGTGALGFVVGRNVVTPLLRSRSLALLIATIGLAIVLEEVMRIANRSRERLLRPILAEPLASFGPAGFTIRITLIQAIVVGTAGLLAAGLALFMRYHRFGRIWRAASQDRRMLGLLGIDLRPVVIGSMVAAALYAAAAGIMIAVYYGSVSFTMGTILGLKALYVAVIGGLDSIGGALAGALMLGFFEAMWSAYLPGDYRDVASFLALSFLLVLRPQGLFAPAGRKDHAI